MDCISDTFKQYLNESDHSYPCPECQKNHSDDSPDQYIKEKDQYSLLKAMTEWNNEHEHLTDPERDARKENEKQPVGYTTSCTDRIEKTG